jgi:hypothetical protein
MEMQSLINTILPLICICIGWFCKELWNAVQELKNDLSDFKASIPAVYMRRDEFHDRWDEIINLLHRIEDKLDQKVDKP